MKPLRYWVSLPLAVVLVALCYRYVDVPVAAFFERLLRWNAQWRHYTAHLPDLLTTFVIVATALSWGAYPVARARGRARDADLLRLIGTCLPVSFGAKAFLKFVFSRTNTRAWLAGYSDQGFHWFHGGALYASFPSGHMTVFAAFFTALWLYYGRLRALYLAMLVVLAVALIATDYHFVSDVVAGAYAGVAVTLAVRWALGRIDRLRNRMS